MKPGYRGTFVISWAQTELDGLGNAPDASLIVGASWRWRGRATRIDGPGDVMVLPPAEEVTELRRHAARTVRRLVQTALNMPVAERLGAPDEPLLDEGFALTDGRRTFTATLIDVPERDQRLLVFLDEMPPTEQDLWVTHVANRRLHPNRSGDVAPGVICFAAGTRIATPAGQRPVQDLAEDDLVLTKDNGPQPVRWTGRHRVSGARLYAMPELRPVLVRSGALGEDCPEGDLLVSPDHRLLVRGEMAEALYGEPEVLIRARDLINDHSIAVDHRLSSVTYHHVMFDAHQIIFANGVETESFHPAHMPLDAIEADQRAGLLRRVPGIEADDSVYGAPARRMLTVAEAAILRFRGLAA